MSPPTSLGCWPRRRSTGGVPALLPHDVDCGGTDTGFCRQRRIFLSCVAAGGGATIGASWSNQEFLWQNNLGGAPKSAPQVNARRTSNWGRADLNGQGIAPQETELLPLPLEPDHYHPRIIGDRPMPLKSTTNSATHIRHAERGMNTATDADASSGVLLASAKARGTTQPPSPSTQ